MFIHIVSKALRLWKVCEKSFVKEKNSRETHASKGENLSFFTPHLRFGGSKGVLLRRPLTMGKWEMRSYGVQIY